jgi:hypothetical protein
MKKQITVAIAAMLVFGTLSLRAQTDTTAPATTTAKTKKARTAAKSKKVEETEEQKAIRDLQEKMAAQQAEINELKQENAAKDAALSAAQSTAATASSQAAAATAQAQSAAAATQSQADAVTSLKSTVTDLQTANVGLATTINTTKSDLNDSINSPAVLHYKGVAITPVAFFAAEDVWRERAMNSDVNTSWNSIPFPSANEGHVGEFNFSGRQSRVGALFSGDAGPFKLSGYVEADFLGTGVTSNNNQSNSYVLRQRQIWGQAAMANGFTLTGGQMWSLVTEDGVSTNNRTEKLPNSVDANYTIGFTWVRQPAIRLQQKWGDPKTGAFTLAMSLEQAQITSFTVNGTGPSNYFFAGAGLAGGLYNAAGNDTYSATTGVAAVGLIANYANNVAPDIIVKSAFDFPKGHIELGGIARFMRDYYYPILGTVGSGGNCGATYNCSPNYVSNTKDAGGVFGTIRVSPSKYADIAVSAMAGDGTGRYGSAQLADATLRPDGTLEPIRNYHGLFSLETHPTPKLDIYGYYGGEYAQRTVYTSLAGVLMGYGDQNNNNTGCYALPLVISVTGSSGVSGTDSPTGSCGGPTRYTEEGMLGFTYRFANSPKFGRFQYQMNYQYVQRNLWSGYGGFSSTTAVPTGPRALDNMILSSFRYYIP